MRKLSLLLSVFLLTLCTACSGTAPEKTEPVPDENYISETDNKYVQLVKDSRRADNHGLTYGEAFSAFFESPTWKHSRNDEGSNIVEFTGGCTYQDVAVDARILFDVDGEKESFEAIYLAFNSVQQDAFTLASLITLAFEPTPDPELEIAETLEEEVIASPGEILYEERPVTNILWTDVFRVMDWYNGERVSPGGNALGESYDLGDIVLYVNNGVGAVNGVTTDNPSVFQINGKGLDVKRNELLTLMDIPYYEGEQEPADIYYGYEMVYYDEYSVDMVGDAQIREYTITFFMSSKEGVVEAIHFWLLPEEPQYEYTDWVYYNGFPINRWIGCTIYDVTDDLGLPIDQGSFEGNLYYDYGGMVFVYRQSDGEIVVISAEPDVCEVNWILFAEPVERNWVADNLGEETSGYYMLYDLGYYTIQVNMQSPDAPANRIIYTPY